MVFSLGKKKKKTSVVEVKDTNDLQEHLWEELEFKDWTKKRLDELSVRVEQSFLTRDDKLEGLRKKIRTVEAEEGFEIAWNDFVEEEWKHQEKYKVQDLSGKWVQEIITSWAKSIWDSIKDVKEGGWDFWNIINKVTTTLKTTWMAIIAAIWLNNVSFGWIWDWFWDFFKSDEEKTETKWNNPPSTAPTQWATPPTPPMEATVATATAGKSVGEIPWKWKKWEEHTETTNNWENTKEAPLVPDEIKEVLSENSKLLSYSMVTDILIRMTYWKEAQSIANHLRNDIVRKKTFAEIKQKINSWESFSSDPNENNDYKKAISALIDQEKYLDSILKDTPNWKTDVSLFDIIASAAAQVDSIGQLVKQVDWTENLSDIYKKFNPRLSIWPWNKLQWELHSKYEHLKKTKSEMMWVSEESILEILKDKSEITKQPKVDILQNSEFDKPEKLKDRQFVDRFSFRPQTRDLMEKAFSNYPLKINEVFSLYLITSWKTEWFNDIEITSLYFKTYHLIMRENAKDYDWVWWSFLEWLLAAISWEIPWVKLPDSMVNIIESIGIQLWDNLSKSVKVFWEDMKEHVKDNPAIAGVWVWALLLTLVMTRWLALVQIAFWKTLFFWALWTWAYYWWTMWYEINGKKRSREEINQMLDQTINEFSPWWSNPWVELWREWNTFIERLNKWQSFDYNWVKVSLHAGDKVSFKIWGKKYKLDLEYTPEFAEWMALWDLRVEKQSHAVYIVARGNKIALDTLVNQVSNNSNQKEYIVEENYYPWTNLLATRV